MSQLPSQSRIAASVPITVRETHIDPAAMTAIPGPAMLLVSTQSTVPRLNDRPAPTTAG